MARYAVRMEIGRLAAASVAILAIAASVAHAQTGSVGANFFTVDRATTAAISGFLLEPPDTSGAVGPNHFVSFNNGSFGIFNKSGGLISRVNDGAFWNLSGVPGVTTAVLTDPRILYDPTSRRWYAVEISVNEATNNRILIARSNTSDPTAGFSAVTLTTSNGVFADFPTLGVDANGLIVGTNNFNTINQNVSTSIYSIPKADLVSNSPPSIANLTQNTISTATNGPVPNPASNFGPKLTTESTPIIWSFNGTTRAIAKISSTSVQTPGGATLAARTLHTVNAITNPNNFAQGGGTMTNGDTRHSSHSVQVGNFLYTATSTNDSGGGGRTSARWTIYNVSGTPTVVSQGNYTDPTLSVFYPSISVNTSGDVVMGFSGSASGVNIGAYAVVGTSSGPGGVITFGSAFQTRAGAGTATNARWGDYSTVNNDPTDPGIFWSHQEYNATAGLNWGTWASEVIPNKTGERRWSNSSGGAFATAGNYFTSTAPVATDNLFFSRPATYSTTFAGANTSNRAFVRQGNVTWNLAGGGSYSLTQAGATTPSLAVSDFQGTSTLTLSGGGLTSVNATIGAGFGGNGTVNVGGAATASWDNSGTIYVGGNSTGPQGGTGRLVVNTGSMLTNATGIVQVHPGGTVGGNGTILGAINVTGGATTVYSDGSLVGTNRVSVNSINVPAAVIAPGLSVGTLQTGPLSISGGGAYAWEVSTVGIPAVTLNSGQSDVGAVKDVLNIVGSLTLNSPEIDVIGLGASGFTNTLPYSWTIATFTGMGTLTGTPTFVAMNLSPLAGSEFSLGVGSGALYLNYSPVPEPVFMLGMSLAAGTVGIWWRNRRTRRANFSAAV